MSVHENRTKKVAKNDEIVCFKIGFEIVFFEIYGDLPREILIIRLKYSIMKETTADLLPVFFAGIATHLPTESHVDLCGIKIIPVKPALERFPSIKIRPP